MAAADRTSQLEVDRPGGSLSVGELAHELNSLLDGSLRLVALALERLDPDGEGLDEAAQRLRMAQEAMWRMAGVLERAMRSGGAWPGTLRGGRSMGEEVVAVLRLVGPMAEAHGVEITWRVSPEAAGLPAGALGVLLLNGLRNGVQACRGAPGPGRVSLEIGLAAPGEVLVEICDSGPGRTGGGYPPGHGLGLELCRRIVADLGGRLELADRPDRPGAVLRVVMALKGAEP
jgi:C4-dicarboxylate-specific signal transduction histidine kinase